MRNRYPYENEAAAEAPAGGGEVTPEKSPQGEPESSVTVIENWRDSLPLDLRDSAPLQDVPDVATLAKQFLDTKAMVGSSIRIPTEEAGQEAIEAFTAKLLENNLLPLMRKPDPDNPDALDSLYTSLGRPEDPSGYTKPEGVDDETFGHITEVAHKLGVSDAQLRMLAEAQVAHEEEVVKAHIEERETGVNQLRGEWGPAYQEKIDNASRIAEALKAPAGLLEALKSNEVDADTLRFLDTIATQVGGEGSPLAEQLDSVSKQTTADLEQRIEERTSRILNEPHMTHREKERLIQANLDDRQAIIDARPRQ